MKERGYVAVFKGSAVEADQVHDYLSENAIGSLVRNHLQENFLAGWMAAEADFSAEVFVSKEDFLKAESLVKNIFHAGLTPDEAAVGEE